VGVWKVEDKDKVVVAGISLSEDTTPPGVDQSYVWQFRIHLPRKYAPCYERITGLVKANAPGGEGSLSSGASFQISEPEQHLVTIALIKADGKWIFCNRMGGSSGASEMPPNFTIDSIDDFIVEPIVEENEIRAFDADEAICLFRLREKVLATDRRGNTKKDLYRGCVTYFFSEEQKSAFTAWSRGQRSSMEE